MIRKLRTDVDYFNKCRKDAEGENQQVTEELLSDVRTLDKKINGALYQTENPDFLKRKLPPVVSYFENWQKLKLLTEPDSPYARLEKFKRNPLAEMFQKILQTKQLQ